MKVLTFDIGGTLIKFAVYDKEKGLIDFKEFEYPKKGRDGILEIISSQADIYEFDCIGICTAGLVDEKKGSIIFSSSAICDYTGTKLKEIFEEKYKKPVWVTNDVNAAALCEAHFGAGRGYNDFICLTYGTGVGGAIVINKQVYTGSNGLAGEIGHIVTHPNGKKCACGAYGCYNEHACTRTLVESCMKININYDNGKKVFEAFNNGNSQVKKEIDEWIDEVVYGLITVTHIFNPPAIILGGGIMKEEYIINEINTRLKEKVMLGYRNVKVISASFANKAGLMGAVQFALERVENDI
ncbi:ROK family protein [Sedimentibacter sp. zth1]|uniref:ROK family protein n=1 Tax=Sedimentibacter sp. zth1 TaxID=2816908 RepID=UPI001A9251F0|nr:ROK family protein [Sedimentibacter sp. zth1]QSX05375.1 ROK family protein [Sedimentibacter sp. zth1]